jgi:hypothetical protein
MEIISCVDLLTFKTVYEFTVTVFTYTHKIVTMALALPLK